MTQRKPTIDIQGPEDAPQFCVIYIVTPHGKPSERRRKNFTVANDALEFLATRKPGTAAAWCRIGLTTYEPLQEGSTPE